MIKLIALDLDNTLLEKNNAIHPHTLCLLRKCISQGIHIVIATGRIYLSAKKYAAEIGSECKILCYNGSLITESDGRPLFSAELSTDIMKKIVSFCKEKDLYCQFYKDHKILVERVTKDTTIDPDLANTQAIEAESFDDYIFSPSPKAMIVAPPERVPYYQAELDRYLAGNAYLAQSQPYLIEIMPKSVNKAKSLELLCNHLGITSNQVMACGDNTNDAEMIRFSGVGVAVANAVDSLKSSAFYVCANQRSLGVAEAIEKFCINTTPFESSSSL